MTTPVNNGTTVEKPTENSEIANETYSDVNKMLNKVIEENINILYGTKHDDSGVHVSWFVESDIVNYSSASLIKSEIT